METMKTFGWCLVLASILLCLLGCMNCNIAIQGTIDDTRQHATTEGRTTSSPKKGAASISAEKTTDVALPVSE